MAMQIILTQDVENLGKAGELVSVRPGYGRNYLVPRGLAVASRFATRTGWTTRSRPGQAQDHQGARADRIATRISGIRWFERMVGEDEKLFSSVTNRDIADQLKRAGVDPIPRPPRPGGQGPRQVRGAGPARAGVVATLKFWVVSRTSEPSPVTRSARERGPQTW
jgi:large subunit ribosomal protein L9